MIFVAVLIVLAYAAVMLLAFALCRVLAEGDRQTVYEPVVRSGEGGCDEDRNSDVAELARPDHGARP